MIEEIFNDSEKKMKKALKSVNDEFKTLRTGRASTGMVENIKVDYYGTPTPINQLAKIQIPDPKQIIIQPYDTDNLKDIEKAILESDTDLTPNSDADLIRIQIPDLTEERRKNMTKKAKEYAEEGKIAIRQIRREAREEIELFENEGEISEDEAYRAKEQIQELTDKYEQKVDEALEKKEDEILTV